MRLLILLIGIVTSPFSIGQNLIPNAGFEYLYRCPNKANQITKAIGWNNPTEGAPDYYNTCNQKSYSVPNNRYGEKPSYQGNAYVAILGRKYSREYIQIRLESPLIKGQKYYSSVHISASEAYQYVSSDIGMLFTKEKITRSDYLRFKNYQPQIENDPDSIFTDYEWHEVKGSFIAKGGEQYLTIGSFRDTVSNVKMVDDNFHREFSWYNFIDNASTEPIIRKKPKNKIQAELNLIKKINFENASHILEALSFDELNKVLKILKINKEISIKVIGHTDNNGSTESNKALSIQRSLAVKNFLVCHGISEKRIRIEGKGDSNPLLKNTTEGNMRINRRVEFKII
jgi:outer membrane protein OmpA-like peptidoglycan-associated protein